VQADRPRQIVEQVGGQPPKCLADAVDRDGANLLGLRLRRARQATPVGVEQDLERVDAIDVGDRRHDGDDAPAGAGRCAVGAVVADHDGRPARVRL